MRVLCAPAARPEQWLRPQRRRLRRGVFGRFRRVRCEQPGDGRRRIEPSRRGHRDGVFFHVRGDLLALAAIEGRVHLYDVSWVKKQGRGGVAGARGSGRGAGSVVTSAGTSDSGTHGNAPSSRVRGVW
jgi:hypothetical protein